MIGAPVSPWYNARHGVDKHCSDFSLSGRTQPGVLVASPRPARDRAHTADARGPLLAGVERSQWWPPEQLHALQETELRRLVQHAYASVPIYRRLWGQARVHPGDITGLDDLPRLPLMDKCLLRAAYPDQALALGIDRRQLVQYASSGSTGQPFQFVMSRAEKGRRWAAMLRCWAWAGAYQGVRQVYIKDGHALGSFSHGLMHQVEQVATRMIGLSAYDVHDEHVDEVIAELQRYQPRVINTYPATGYRLARRWKNVALGFRYTRLSPAAKYSFLPARGHATLVRLPGTRLLRRRGHGRSLSVRPEPVLSRQRRDHHPRGDR